MSRVLLFPSILVCLLSMEAWADASPPATDHLSYVASYQGLLSAGFRLDIAGVHLDLSANSESAELQARMAISTRGYDGADALFPVNFCYHSRVDGKRGATLESNWWSRIGSKATRGRLSFDQDSRTVQRLHAERKLEDGGSAAYELIQAARRDEQPNLDRDQVPFPPGVGPMDRLAMLLWLRRQSLQQGEVFEPAVSNGRKLSGYRIEVEGREQIELNGAKHPSLRIRFDAKDASKPDAEPTYMWISDDPQRLPLRFRSSRGFGSFELRLLSASSDAPEQCHVVEAADLSLPSPQ